ncbi:hypothetical protein GX51_01952 [Blastomyces parvus]|uniref:Uncharacterized protein n=1 Tax=Blastomyces parvus TaxID=2060905 RepID=A0A2B7XDZ5_9EURO|nr:hypothetical protein GX51_01952 [Blastomyces parvus]
MKTFYALALLIAAAVVNASPVAQPAKLVAKAANDAEVAGHSRYATYVVPAAEDEEQY